MRPFLISFLLLISTGYSWPWPWSAPREPPLAALEPPPPPATRAPTEPPAGGPLKCYTGEKNYQNGREISSERIEEVTCKRLCSVSVWNSDNKKSWRLYCEEKRGGTKHCYSRGGPHFECYCDTDLCFTSEIAEQVMEQAPEAGQRYMAGGSSEFKKLFSISSSWRGKSNGNKETGSDSGSPNTGDVPQETPGGVNPAAYPVYSHGTDVSSTTSFLFSSAALLLAT